MQTPVFPLPLTDPTDEAPQPGEASALTALYERSVDSAKGFAKMVEKAEPEFRATAERFRTLHARHVEQLAPRLAARGAAGDGEGTLMGTVNAAVVAFRAFFDDIDEDVMDQVRSGEDWVLKMFDEAISEASEADAGVADAGLADAGLAEKLRAMRTELTDLLADTRHLG